MLDLREPLEAGRLTGRADFGGMPRETVEDPLIRCGEQAATSCRRIRELPATTG